MARPVGLTKICPGYYAVDVTEGRRLVIDQLEEGDYRAWWIVRAEWDPYLLSDPEPTLRDAAQVAQEMKTAWLRGDLS